MTPFGERLEKARARKNCNKGDILKAAYNTSSGMYSQWLNGAMPEYKKLMAIADFLGVNIDWLEKGQGTMIKYLESGQHQVQDKNPEYHLKVVNNPDQNNPLLNKFSSDTIEGINQLDEPSVKLLESLINNFNSCDQAARELIVLNAEAALSGSQARAEAKNAERKKTRLKDVKNAQVQDPDNQQR